MESFWLIFVVVFIFLLVIGQVFKFYFSYNIYENDGFILLKMWFIPIKQFSFQITLDSIVIRTKKGKNEISYNFNDPKLKFYEKFSKQLKEKMRTKYIDIYSNVGVGDAAETALISGIINIFYKIISAYIKNVKPTCTINITPNTDFKNKVFNFYFFGKVSLSIFDFMYCFIYALLLTGENT